MKIVNRPFEGVIVIEPQRHIDERGFFLESYESKRFESEEITSNFVQDNHSRSNKGVLRGLHFTRKKKQAQLLTVIRGSIFDVVVDIRPQSKTFGKWYGTELRDDKICQIYMEHGFAHGFYVLSDYADLHYKVTEKYDGSDEGGLRWNDEKIAINWPSLNPLISERDKQHPFWKDYLGTQEILN